MKKDRRYDIDIYGLKIGLHEYQLSFDKSLFEEVEEGLVETGKGDCKIIIDKKETMMTFSFEINGLVELTCDRSNEQFDHTIDIHESLIVKYGDEYDDSNDDLLVIPNGQQAINVEDLIYQYVTMAVPMKKLHPRFGNEEDEEEGYELVYTSNDFEEDGESTEDNKETDPRWEMLKKLKNSDK